MTLAATAPAATAPSKAPVHHRKDGARLMHVLKTCVRAYLSEHTLVRHQIESANVFYTSTLPQIVQETSSVVINSPIGERHVIRFGRTTMPRPQNRESDRTTRFITPHEARTRSLTYSAPVFVNVTHDVFALPLDARDTWDVVATSSLKHISGTLHREVVLCHLPVMVRSVVCCLNDDLVGGGGDGNDGGGGATHECMYDYGGYFIVNGTEKVLISQETLRRNYRYVFAAKPSTRFSLQAEVRSCHSTKVRSTSTICFFLSDTKSGAAPEVAVSIPFVMRHVPLLVLFRLLGVDSIDAMFRWIVGDVADADQRYGQRFALMARSVLDCDIHVVDAAAGSQAGDFNNGAQRGGDMDAHGGGGGGLDVINMPIDDLCNWVGLEGLTESDRAQRIRSVNHIVTNEVFPHVGLDNALKTRMRKVHFLGYVVRKLLLVSLGLAPCDDRDHYANKRVDCAGVLLALIFRQRFRAFLKNLQFSMSKQTSKGIQHIDVIDSINQKSITAGLKYAFATGNWGVQKGGSAQTGVAQVMTRLNKAATDANLRNVNTPINRDGKNPKPRQLHVSHYHIMCPVKTPEGASTGLIKNLAMLAHIRTGYDPTFIERRIDFLKDEFQIAKIDDVLANVGASGGGFIDGAAVGANSVIVQVNGAVYGFVGAAFAKSFLQRMRALRRVGTVPFDVSIVHRHRHQHNEIAISTDSGCVLRPVLCLQEFYAHFDTLVERTDPAYLWSALLLHGVVEYVDKEEELDMMIATYWTDADTSYHTHAELHPSLMFSTTAALIPFPEMNQAPRNMYYCSMASQAVGTYSTNPASRFDTLAHQLWYPQRPLVHTVYERLLDADEMPNGQNAVVAILCKKGYNQEDSIIMNRAAIDRGMFRSFKTTCVRDEEKSMGANVERFENPTAAASASANGSGCGATVGMRDADYSHLEADGMPAIGAELDGDVAIVGKTMATTPVVIDSGGGGAMNAPGLNNFRLAVTSRDRSSIHRCNAGTRVDSVMLTSNRPSTKQSANSVKVKLREMRVPEIGDKLASRHGQKGVIGMTLRHEDMPFIAGLDACTGGIVPDLLINPHAIPSRMTMGHLAEMMLGLFGATSGQFDACDATAFQGSDVESIADELAALGLPRYAKHQMIDGMTGEPIEALVYTGVIYYQRLRHMVADKIHGRTRGPVQILTRQPVEGRSRDGGLRFGEMERDTIISHGASGVMQSMLLHNSDAYTAPVCGGCGLTAIPTPPPPPSGRGTFQHQNIQQSGGGAYCQNCRRGDLVQMTTIPYAFKLLQNELAAMHISMRIRLEPAATATATATAH